MLWNRNPFGRHGWPLWLILLIGLFILAAGLGLRSPWPSDEPRFMLIAREMLDTGNWLFPHRAGELYPDKPPVFFWAIALFIWLTGGAMKAAHLLPGLMSGLACLAMIYDLARRLYSRRVATAAALLLLFSFQFTDLIRSSHIDGFLLMWTTLGLYGLCRHLLLGPSWGFYTLGGFAMGVGIITKGVGFLPILILLPYVLMRLQGGWQGLAPVKGTWQWLLAPLAMLFAVSLWLVPMLWVVAHSADPALQAYRDNIMLKQTAQRYSDPWGHFKPFWYYFVSVIPLLWFPFSVLLVWLLPTWGRRLRRRNARVMLPLAWVVLVLLFFSISPAKRGLYILPALPGMILAAAPLLPALFKRRSVRYTAFACGLLLGIVVLLALGYLRFLEPDKVVELMADLPNVNPWPPLITLGVVFVVAVLWARPRRGLLGLALGMAGLWMIYGYWVAPALDYSLSGKRIMTAVDAHLPAGAELAMVNWRGRMVLNANRPVTQFGYRTPSEQQVEDASAWLLQRPDGQRWVLATRDGYAPCFDKNKGVYVGHAHDRKWYLIAAHDVVANPPASCTLPAPRQAWTSPALTRY